MRNACNSWTSQSLESPLEENIDSLNLYVEGCIAEIQDVQGGQIETTVGTLNRNMTDVPFDGNRAELVGAFRMLAVGNAIPSHPLRTQNTELFQAYSDFARPAFTQ